MRRPPREGMMVAPCAHACCFQAGPLGAPLQFRTASHFRLNTCFLFMGQSSHRVRFDCLVSTVFFTFVLQNMLIYIMNIKFNRDMFVCGVISYLEGMNPIRPRDDSTPIDKLTLKILHLPCLSQLFGYILYGSGI